MVKPDGGPAFPTDYEVTAEEGMTLRDWFAGQVLAAMLPLVNQQAVEARVALGVQEAAKGMAVDAYRVADAMLEARDADTED